MDPVTHGLIGATINQSLADNKTVRSAAFIGGISAMAADLDIFIANPSDPLLNIEFHRQFTHSLLFIPVGAFVVSLLFWWIFRRQLSYRQIYGYSIIGYSTSGIADTMTSYGTQLLWPFMDERFSFNIISVFDPLFTAGILFIAGYSFYQKKGSTAWFAILWMVIYLLFGVYQREKSRETARQIAGINNHRIDRVVVKPTIANQLLWSIRYQSGDSLFTAAARLSPFSEKTIYKGEATALIDWRREYATFKGTTLYNDLQRFSELSEGFLTRHPEKDQVIGDARYSMLPTSATPLWGVKVDTTQPHKHLPFNNFRNAGPEVRASYLKMLRGN